MSTYPAIHSFREYVKVINSPKPLKQSLWSFYIRLENNLLYMHIDQFTLTFEIRLLGFTLNTSFCPCKQFIMPCKNHHHVNAELD